MKINGTTLFNELKNVVVVTGSELVNLSVNKQKVTLSASNEGKTFVKSFATDSKDSFHIAIRPDELKKVLKGIVNLIVDKSTITISTASYKAELSYEPYTEPELQNIETGLSKKCAEELHFSSSATTLAPMMGDLLYSFNCDSTGFLSATWDRIHFCMWKSGVKSKEASGLRTRSVDIANLLAAVPPEEEGLKFSIGAGTMSAATSDTYLVLPAIQPEEGPGLPQLEEFSKSFGKGLCNIIVADLIEALERAASIAEQGAATKIKTSNNKILISTTGKAKFKEVVTATVKKEADFSVDPSLFLDILYRYQKDSEVLLGYNGKLVWLVHSTDKGALISAALTTQEEQ
jgi:hypothetical protein